MILTAQQTKASVMSSQAAMSSAGICSTTNATTCIGVVNNMASQPTVAMLPRRARPIRIAKDVAQHEEIGTDPGDPARPHLVDHDGSDVALVCGEQCADQVEAVNRGHREGAQIARQTNCERDGGEYRTSTPR